MASMEISRHPGYVEIKLPELFDADTRADNLSRVFTAIQPGTNKLMIDVASHRGRMRVPDESEVLHLCRRLTDALESMSDTMELIALVCRADQSATVRPYVHHLEHSGFDIRLFTRHETAVGWLGRY